MITRESILDYPQLDPDARTALESAVRADGRFVDLLEEVKLLTPLLDESRRHKALPEDLAYRVACEMTGGAPGPMLDRVKDEAAKDGDLETDRSILRVRAEEFLQGHDPLAHFESLRRERLHSPGASDRSATDDVAAVATDVSSRGPVRRMRHRLAFAEDWAFLGVAGMIILLTAGILAFALAPRDSELARLGHFEVDEVNPHRYLVTARSADSFALTPTDSLLLRAQRILVDARQVRFGIVVTYDRELVGLAAADLSEIIARLPEDDYVSLEARYLRAKTSLIQENPRRAILDLETLLQRGSARTERARTLLHETQALLD